MIFAIPAQAEGWMLLLRSLLLRIKTYRPSGIERFRLTARYFLLLAQKKVPKENGLPRDIKPAHGICGAVAIFGHAIHGVVRKRPASMPAALRVCMGNCACGAWKIKSRVPA